MTFLPLVIHAEYCGDYRIHLTFNDNSETSLLARSDPVAFACSDPLREQDW